jgi:hypothetical protein
MPVTLEFDTVANVSEAIDGFRSIVPTLEDVDTAAESASSGGVGKFVGGIGDVAGKALSLVNPIGLATNAIGFLGPKLLDAGKAAAAEAQEQEQLANTLRNSVPGWNGNTAAIDEAVAAGQRKAFSDSDLRASLGQLATDTGSVEEAIRLQGLAMDLAASKGIPLAAATNLVGKADDESYAALAKLGIEIDKNATREDALAAIHTKTAGAADIFANSTEGAAIRAGASMDDALETIGGAVMPALTEAMTMFADFMAGDTFNGAISFVSDLLTNTLGPAFDFIKGLMEPLVAAVQPLITAIMGVGIGAAGTGEPMAGFKEMLNTVQGFILTNVIPVVGQIASFLAENLPAAIQFAKNAWTNVLQPALQQAWSFFKDSILPILGQVASFLMTNLPPAIAMVAEFWQTRLQPALSQVWSLIQTKVLPVFGLVANVLQTVIPPILDNMANSWNNIIQPARANVWAFIDQNVLPILGVLVTEGFNRLGDAVTLVTNLWNNNLKPALSIAATFIGGTLVPGLKTLVNDGLNAVKTAASGLASFWNGSLKPAIEGVANAVGKVIQFLKDLANGLTNIDLPDWLTPGSPTPWEIGLIGIGRAMKQVAGTELPRLAKELAALPEPGDIMPEIQPGTVRPKPGQPGYGTLSAGQAVTPIALALTVNIGGQTYRVDRLLEAAQLEINLSGGSLG